MASVILQHPVFIHRRRHPWLDARACAPLPSSYCRRKTCETKRERERESPFPSIQSTDDVSHHSDRTDQSCKRWAGPAPIHPPRHPLTHLMYNFFSSSPPAQFSFSRCIRHKKYDMGECNKGARDIISDIRRKNIYKKKPYLSFLNKTHECCNILFFIYTDTIIRRMSSQRERG